MLFLQQLGQQKATWYFAYFYPPNLLLLLFSQKAPLHLSPPLSLRLLVLCRKASSAASSGMRKRRPHPAAAWTDSCRISCAAAAAAARRCDCAELNDPSTRRPVRLAQGECAAAVAAEKLAIRCFCVCVCYPTDEDKRHRASRRRRTGSARHLMPLLMLMGGFQVSWWVWFSFF